MSSNKNKRPTRRPTPHLENLESRVTPTTNLDGVPFIEPTEPTDMVVTMVPPTEPLVVGGSYRGHRPDVGLLMMPPIKPLVVDPAQLQRLTKTLVESPEFLGNQVEIAFQKVLGRPSQQAGKAAWTKALASDALDTEDLSVRFIATEEFLGNADYNAFTMVKFLFATYLDRQPDQGGLTNWVRQIDSLSHLYLTGKGIDAWIAMEDPKYGTAEDPNFIGLAPENRTPEQLGALKLALAKVAEGIRDSEEAVENTIESLYLGILDRVPSQEEVDVWENTQISEEEMLAGFLSSKEYQGQFQSYQAMVVSCYADVLFRPVGIQGLDRWSESFGAVEGDFSWLSQVPGVQGEKDVLNDQEYNAVVDLLYANHVNDTKPDDLAYLSEFNPNYLANIMSQQMELATPSSDEVLPFDYDSFWETVEFTEWNPLTGDWEYDLKPGFISTDPTNPDVITYDFMGFLGEMSEADMANVVNEFLMGAWDWVDSNLGDSLPSDWAGGDTGWNINLDHLTGGSIPWDWGTVPDPNKIISPDYPFYASYSANGDVNGDGVEDSIVSSPLYFDISQDPSVSTQIDVYSGLPEEGILYSFIPYEGQSNAVPVAVGDFDGNGSMEILTSILPTEDNLDPNGVRPEIKVFSGKDGSFLHSFPVPADMTWTTVVEIPPGDNEPGTSYAFAPGISGVLVGARNLMTSLAGTDQILLATQGSKLEVWVGTVIVAADLPWTIKWTEISATVANAKDAAGELLWPKHAILGNLAAFAISTWDVNNDGQDDIGITAGVISDEADDVPPPAMDIYWFDGTTHEPIEMLLLPDPIAVPVPTTEE